MQATQPTFQRQALGRLQREHADTVVDENEGVRQWGACGLTLGCDYKMGGNITEPLGIRKI